MTKLFTGALRSVPDMYVRWLWYRYCQWHRRRKPMNFYSWAAMIEKDRERGITR